MEIRQALESELRAVQALDPVTNREEGRRTFLERAVREGSLWGAWGDGILVGFVTLEYSFYDQGFLSLLHVHSEYRRQGIASALVERMESLCKTRKLFTSTNESNLPMQGVMVHLGYVPSGVINNLDEGDPEVVFFKALPEPTL